MRIVRSIVSVVAGSVVAVVVSLPAWAACSHPYFVLKKGATHVYKMADGRTSTWRVEKVEGDKATIQTTFDMAKDGETAPAGGGDRPKEMTSEMVVDCSKEGITLDMSKMTMSGMRGPMGSMQMKVVKHEGVSFPAKLSKGSSWKTSQTLEMTPPGGNHTMDMDQTTEWTVTGSEKVTTPAGSFDALKLEGTTSSVVQMPGGAPAGAPHGGMGGPGAGGGMNIHGKSTLWLAKGVGIVKMDHETEGMAGGAGSKRTVMELVKK